MMLFATSGRNQLMHDRPLMLSFQVRQNATTVTLQSTGNCRQLPTTARSKAASKTEQEASENLS